MEDFNELFKLVKEFSSQKFKRSSSLTSKKLDDLVRSKNPSQNNITGNINQIRPSSTLILRRTSIIQRCANIPPINLHLKNAFKNSDTNLFKSSTDRLQLKPLCNNLGQKNHDIILRGKVRTRRVKSKENSCVDLKTFGNKLHIISDPLRPSSVSRKNSTRRSSTIFESMTDNRLSFQRSESRSTQTLDMI